MSVARPIPSRARTMTSRSSCIAVRLPCRRPAFPLNPRAVPQMARARSSAGEHYVDIVGVTGSIPVAPTILISRLAFELSSTSEIWVEELGAGCLHLGFRGELAASDSDSAA